LVAIFQLGLLTAVGLGLERGLLLEEVGVREEQLLDRDAYLPLSALLGLGESMLRQRPGVNIGLSALEFVRPSTLGALGYVIGNCVNLGEALEAFARYQSLLTPAVRWESSTVAGGGREIRLVASPAFRRLAFPVEIQLGTWISIGRRLTGMRWTPRRVRLQHQPLGPAEEFSALFGQVEFGASVDALELDAEVLALPVVGARPELQLSSTRLVQSLLPEPEGEVDCRARVRTLLHEGISHGMTTKEQAARELGLSPRTLSRRLQEEGSSFSDLLREVREQLARVWLRDPALSIYEVAYLLGYSQPSTFHRSFRRWTGQTPMHWRAG